MNLIERAGNWYKSSTEPDTPTSTCVEGFINVPPGFQWLSPKAAAYAGVEPGLYPVRTDPAMTKPKLSWQEPYLGNTTIYRTLTTEEDPEVPPALDKNYYMVFVDRKYIWLEVIISHTYQNIGFFENVDDAKRSAQSHFNANFA